MENSGVLLGGDQDDFDEPLGIAQIGDADRRPGGEVIAVEPGGMRTNWGQVARGNIPAVLPDYEPSVGAITALLSAYVGKEFGDPEKVAQVILDLASRTDLPAHLLLGSDAIGFVREKLTQSLRDIDQWEALTRSTDGHAS